MDSLLDTHFEKGQSELVFNIKSLIYKRYPHIFNKLDFDNDDIFLEPLLFGFFTEKTDGITIEQILFGHISNEKKPNEINVFSNEKGVIYLPNYGYLHTERYEEKVTLKYCNKKEVSLYTVEGDKISYQFEKLIYLEEAPKIEVCMYSNPVYTQIFNKWGNIEYKIIQKTKQIPNYREEYDQKYDFLKSIKKDTLKVLESINLAFSILKEHTPTEYIKYTKSTKRIVCFNNPLMRGFVTKNVHGTSFLSISDNSNVTFFLDEIVHQCSHNVFNAMTSNIKEYIKVDKNTPLKQLTSEIHDSWETRNIYDAFHGLYTVNRGMYSLIPILKNYNFDIDKKNELFGRIAIKGIRFRTGIQNVMLNNTFTKKGLAIYETLDSSCCNIMKKNPKIFSQKNNFSNQPQVFSYKKFLEQNPM